MNDDWKTGLKPPRPDLAYDGRGAAAAWSILKIKSLLAELAPGQVLVCCRLDRAVVEDIPRTITPPEGRLLNVRKTDSGYSIWLTK